MRPRLITCTVAANDPTKLKAFYENVFGFELGLALTDNHTAHHSWISAGVKFNVNNRHHPDEHVMLHFAVDDLQGAIKKAEASGGKLTHGPEPMPIAPSMIDRFRSNYAQYKLGTTESVSESMGSFAVIDDAEGNPLGLIQLEPWAEKLFQNGEVTKFEHVEQERALESGRVFSAQLAERLK